MSDPRAFAPKRIRDQQGEPISAALRRVDAAFEEPVTVEEPPRAEIDTAAPAVAGPAIEQEKAYQLVSGITLNMLGELRALRDQIDQLTKEASDRRDQIVEAIAAHATFTDAAIAHKMIISDALEKMRAEFEKSRTPLPPVRSVR